MQNTEMHTFRFTCRPSIMKYFQAKFHHEKLAELNHTTFTDIYYDKHQMLSKQNITLRFREGEWCMRFTTKQGHTQIDDEASIAKYLTPLFIVDGEAIQETPLSPYNFFDSGDAICIMFTHRLVFKDSDANCTWCLDAVQVPRRGWLMIGEVESADPKAIDQCSSQISDHISNRILRKIDLFLNKGKLDFEEFSAFEKNPISGFVNTLCSGSRNVSSWNKTKRNDSKAPMNLATEQLLTHGTTTGTDKAQGTGTSEDNRALEGFAAPQAWAEFAGEFEGFQEEPEPQTGNRRTRENATHL